MLPSKSCKTINANFLLKNFGLTFFDRFKTGTYLVIWFGRGSADQTLRFGGLAEPCRTSKFGRYRCRCRFIGRSLVNSDFNGSKQTSSPMSLKLNVSFGIWISTNCPRFDNGILDPENIKNLISGLFFLSNLSILSNFFIFLIFSGF